MYAISGCPEREASDTRAKGDAEPPGNGDSVMTASLVA
jgi:hypothetical protein